MDYIMKKLLVLLLLLISTLAFAGHITRSPPLIQLQADENDILKRVSLSSIDCWEYDGVSSMISKGDTDSICKYKNSNGQKSSEGVMNNGIERGKWTYWWKNGQKKGEINWGNGKKIEGTFYAWHDNGQKAEEGSFKDGMRDGDWTWWHENGNKKYEVNYKANLNNGKWIKWDENGQIIIEAVYNNDNCISGDCTGQI
jgi:hypothetical protein